MCKAFVLGPLLIMLVIGTAHADVSNELIIGWAYASQTGFTGTLSGSGLTMDIPQDMSNRHDSFTASYTHFFKPLTSDDMPIELRRFSQHPSLLTVELFGSIWSGKDGGLAPTVNYEQRSTGLTIGAEYFLPSGTGFIVDLGGGIGTYEWTRGAGLEGSSPRTFRYRFGVAQYVAPNAALHVEGERQITMLAGSERSAMDRGILAFGARWAIGNLVGLSLDLGRGQEERHDGYSVPIEYELSQLRAELTVYAGRHLSLRLTAEQETKEAPLTPDGHERRTEYTQVTTALKYWFGEQWALEVPVHVATAEYLDEAIVMAGGLPVGTFGLRTTTRSKGAGLFITHRF